MCAADAPPAWLRPTPPGPMTLQGRYARVAPLASHHAAALHAACAADEAMWRYLGYGPFADAATFATWTASVVDRPDPRFFAIEDHARPGPGGFASLMRVDVANGVIEVGNIALSPALRRTRAASEAIFLLADWAFAAGFRRLEWKCNARNAPSRRAATRYGFFFEGVFRQHMIVKGRNRDTAWFAIIDGDWPALRAAHLRWLDPANFDDQVRQRRRLAEFSGPVLARAEAAAARAHAGP